MYLETDSGREHVFLFPPWGHMDNDDDGDDLHVETS